MGFSPGWVLTSPAMPRHYVGMTNEKGKTPGESAVETRYLVMPQQANPQGTAFGDSGVRPTHFADVNAGKSGDVCFGEHGPPQKAGVRGRLAVASQKAV